MNILHVTPTYYPATRVGGPVHSVYALNNALAQIPGLALKVLTTDAAGAALDDRLKPAELTALYPRQEIFFARRVISGNISVQLLQMLPRLVRWADVVHLTGTYSFPTLPTLFLCRVMNKPLVWSHRGAILDAYEWAGAPRKRLKRIWEKLCNALISPGRVAAHVTSEREQEAAQSRVPKVTTLIVPNGVDTPTFLPDRDWQPGGRLRLMYLGRISQKKGIENLIYALSDLADPSITLTIYGTGPPDYEASVKKLAADLEFPKGAVTFAGHVAGEAKTLAFQSADICVVPSFSENFCIVVAEALAHGVPVIASRGTPWSRVEEKQCGLWVDNSPKSLAGAIARIRTMPLQVMGQRGRAWMKDAFSWNVIATEMAAAYKSLSQPKVDNTL